jgi:DNA repair exonuclease SbcCD ATPase subunit
MKFLKLYMDNFFRTHKVEVGLSKQGIINVVGINKDTGMSNETGKSTIFEAICWCLYGRYASGGARAGDEIINPLYKDEGCLVRLEVEKNGQQFIFERTKNYKIDKSKDPQSILYIKCNGDDVETENFILTGKSIAAGTKRVSDIIGMDYDTYTRAHYLPQSGVVPFGQMTDGELKQYFISKLLQVEWTETALSKAKDEGKLIEGKRIGTKEAIELNKKDLEALQEQLSDYTNRRDNHERENKTKRRRLEEELRAVSDRRDALKVEIQNVKQKLDSFVGSFGKATLLRKKADEKEAEAHAKKRELTKIANEITALDSKTRELLQWMDSLVPENEVCEYCGNKATKESLDKLIGDKQLLISKYDKEKLGLKNQVARLEDEHMQMMFSLEKDMQYVIALEKKEKEQTLEIERLKSFLQYKTTESLDEQIQSIKYQINEIDKEKNPYNEIVENATNSIEETSNDISEAEEELVRLERQFKLTSFWERGFSREGIQSFILDSVTPQINSGISYYLKYLSEGRIKAWFETVTKLKSGEYREKFGLKIKNMDGGEGYQSLSGGAQRRVDLCCALALSDFKRSLTKEPLEFLVLDETCNNMDSYWEDKFLQMIKENYSNYSTFVISHKQLPKHLFDHEIRLVKEKGITKLED